MMPPRQEQRGFRGKSIIQILISLGGMEMDEFKYPEGTRSVTTGFNKLGLKSKNKKAKCTKPKWQKNFFLS